MSTGGQTMFINHEYINEVLEKGKESNREEILNILEKAEELKGLTHIEIAKLLNTEDKDIMQKVFETAGRIKRKIYGKRVVLFAPLYISNYCVNNCTYCGYQCKNKFNRKKLTQDEIRQEVRILEDLGHKRLALEVGEDDYNCPIEYILESIDTIYSTENKNGNIRRINVNIAATTVENYKKLKDKEIGTYILFQETYHKPTYEAVHPDSIKGNYDYHLTAFDRAMEAGIDDVGGGVLFGLSDYKFEVMALMLHNEHLEEEFNVGFHTISVPRLKKAEGMSLDEYPHAISDDDFKKLTAIIRLAVPFTGMILSTRETAEIREELINYGISQLSAGSCTGVGGYKEKEEGKDIGQFQLSDERSPLEIVKSLVGSGFIPSYCTACYRSGRTGDVMMDLAKQGKISTSCTPNALMTLMEYVLDYGDNELKTMGENLVKDEVAFMTDGKHKIFVQDKLEKIIEGKRDFYI
jgi:2-iminoacetate synthase